MLFDFVSRKPSEKINIDEVSLRERIIELKSRGYLRNYEAVRAPIIDRIIAILGRDECQDCGQLTERGYNALDEVTFEDIITRFDSKRGMFKRIQKRPKSIFSKLIDGVMHLIGIAIFLILIVVVLAVIGIILLALWIGPEFFSGLMESVFSILPF